jgi:hypothetical protein
MIASWFITSMEYWKTWSPWSKASRARPAGEASNAFRSRSACCSLCALLLGGELFGCLVLAERHQRPPWRIWTPRLGIRPGQRRFSAHR